MDTTRIHLEFVLKLSSDLLTVLQVNILIRITDVSPAQDHARLVLQQLNVHHAQLLDMLLIQLEFVPLNVVMELLLVLNPVILEI